MLFHPATGTAGACSVVVIAMAAAWEEVLDLRARLHGQGWRIVPLCERTKSPVFADWPQFHYDPADPEPPTPRTRNAKGEPTRAKHLGTGAICEGLVAIDFDIEDADRARAARVAFEQVAEASPVVRFRPGAARSMLFYGPDEGVTGISTSIGEGPAKIEIFADHGGRQVMIHGTHPSGAMLQYEGDEPADWRRGELPRLDRATLHAAFKAALEAAGISTEGKEAAGGGVRRQATLDDATRALAAEIARIMSGESVHRASNAAGDLLAFHLGLDAEQGARVLAALALAAETGNPADAARYQEMATKSFSRAQWYARRAEEPPADQDKLTFWRRARVAQFKRAWRVLPADLRAQFLETAERAKGAK